MRWTVGWRVFKRATSKAEKAGDRAHLSLTNLMTEVSKPKRASAGAGGGAKGARVVTTTLSLSLDCTKLNSFVNLTFDTHNYPLLC